MPKSKLADMISHKADNDYVQNVATNIAHEMFTKNITIKDISKKTGIAESTIRLRMNQPGTFKQMEIVEIAKVLKISPFTLVSQKLSYTVCE